MKGEATMSSDATVLKVEQCDREVAIEAVKLRRGWSSKAVEYLLAGQFDGHDAVRAASIARHRLQSELTQAREDLERARSALEKVNKFMWSSLIGRGTAGSTCHCCHAGWYNSEAEHHNDGCLLLETEATLSLINTPAKDTANVG